MSQSIIQKNQGYGKEEKEIEMPDQPVQPVVPNPSARQKSKQNKDEDCVACAEGPNDDSAVQGVAQEEVALEDDVYPEPKPRTKGEGLLRSKPRAKRRQ